MEKVKIILGVVLLTSIISCSTEPVINTSVTVNNYYQKKTDTVTDTIVNWPVINDSIVNINP